MRRPLCVAATVVALVGITGGSASGGFVFVDFSEHHNARMQDFATVSGFATEYPEGLSVLGGVEFAIPEGGPNTWSAAAAAVAAGGDGPVSIDIDVNAFSAQLAHILITTHKGESLPGTFASLEFFGSGGAYFLKELDGGNDMRDWLFSEYTNTINGGSTVEVLSVGSGYQTSYRLDMLTVALPSQFLGQTLESIRVNDSGGNELQRLHIHGITITVVPEPSTLALAALGGFAVAGRLMARRKPSRGL